MAPHLHYSIITAEAGKSFDPWNPLSGGSIGFKVNEGATIDPANYDKYDVPTPPHLDEFQRAAQIVSGGKANPAPNALPPDNPRDRFFNPFEKLNSAPAGIPPPASSDSFADRFTKWGSVPQGNGSPAAPDAAATFDSRFGSWGFAPAGGFGDTNSPVLRALERNRRSEIPDGLAPTSAQAAPSSPVLGIFSGQPMPNYPVPPPIWGLPDEFQAAANADEDWYSRWRRLIGPE